MVNDFLFRWAPRRILAALMVTLSLLGGCQGDAPSAGIVARERDDAERGNGEAPREEAAAPVTESPKLRGGDLKQKQGLAAAPRPAPPGVAQQEGGSIGIAGGGKGSPARAADGYGVAAPAPEVTIDPNGRFATTYRPGGGHLAAFESAVARGIVPSADRDLVGDVGARYTPAMDAPKGKALALRVDTERGKLPPSGGDTHLRIALRSTTDKAARPHLSVHLVLDVSGSMKGASIARAREAALALVEKLDGKDDFSLVTFSSEAKVLIADGPVGARRASLKETISGIVEGGGTNIGQGLSLGYEQASTKSIPADAVRVVLLLSDGRANAGITSRERLSKLSLDAFQSGVQTSAFGLGTDYDGELMSAIANDGAGGYYYLRDPEQIAPALATELEKRLDPVALAVEVRVRLKPDVGLMQVYGSRRLTQSEAARVRAIEVASDQQAEKREGIQKDRADDPEGGMRFFIPAFARDDAHALLLKVRIPAGASARKIASIELKYKDRVAKKNVTEEIDLSVDYASSDAASAASADPSVAKTVQGFAAGETLAEAARRIGSGDRNGAAAMLSEREALLRTAAETLKEPLFLKDADRLARLASQASATGAMGDPLVLAMLLETASRSHLH